MTTINNINALAGNFDCAPDDIARRLYKATDCGAWIDMRDDKSVLLGSIVEGCDFGTATYRLTYPFTMEDFDARIKAIEAEADALWKWANEQECEGDAPDVDYDYQHLNPEGRSS